MMLEALRALALSIQITSKQASVRNTLEGLLKTIDILEDNACPTTDWDLVARYNIHLINYAFNIINVTNPTDAVIEQAVDLLKEALSGSIRMVLKI